MTLRDLNIVADALAYSIESLEIAIPASDISSVERGDEWLGTIARFPQLRDVTIHPRFRHSSLGRKDGVFGAGGPRCSPKLAGLEAQQPVVVLLLHFGF
jgi:hypothetical protein